MNAYYSIQTYWHRQSQGTEITEYKMFAGHPQMSNCLLAYRPHIFIRVHASSAIALDNIYQEQDYNAARCTHSHTPSFFIAHSHEHTTLGTCTCYSWPLSVPAVTLTRAAGVEPLRGTPSGHNVHLLNTI
eukprot:947552-Pleurochrysis_carterae.AAC.1